MTGRRGTLATLEAYGTFSAIQQSMHERQFFLAYGKILMNTRREAYHSGGGR